MSELKLNLSDYKSSGVYFVEVDNSAISSRTYNAASRLAVGFNMTGPFNRPVYLSGPADVSELFGGIDRKLERKGCFTNRNIRTMVSTTPIFAINLMPIDTKESSANSDTVGYATLSLSASKANFTGDNTLYAYMYDRSRFWVADDTAFVRNTFLASAQWEWDSSAGTTETQRPSEISQAAMFGLGNCGTKDISVIVRKAEGLTGYNVTFLDWYGNAESIPYKWINPNDYVSDYFVQVIAIAGKWNEDLYKAYSTDAVWSAFFTEKGLKKEKLSKFLRLDAVEVLGNWTGCILPNFLDKQGTEKSIDYVINKSCNTTGLLWGLNTAAMDTLCLSNKSEVENEEGVSEIIEGEYRYFLDNDGDGIYGVGDMDAIYVTDLVGHTVKSDELVINDFLSYSFDPSTLEKYVYNIKASKTYQHEDASGGMVDVSVTGTQFVIESDDVNINVGDLVRTVDGLMSRITKKRCFKEGEGETAKIVTIYTALNTVQFSEDSMIEVHKNYTDMYDAIKFLPLTGLKIRNKHLPGYDKDGKVNYEAGVEKIYAMLEDEGIHKGLLNEDMIDFRYIVDTMAYGLDAECGAKKHLTKLAMEKGHCTALCNAPSMSQFAESDNPFFGDTYQRGEDPVPSFSVKYIPAGGNQDMVYSDPNTPVFSLPTEENGAYYCAFFAPFLKYTEGLKTILVPPAADVSNTFVRRFITGNPYATVANYNGILTNGQISDVEYLFDSDDRGYLEPFGINPIISRQGNILIYGDRTAYQTVNSDLSFLHARELLNTIEINCKNVLDKYVFTYNTPAVRAEIVSKLNPILSAMKDCQALAKYEIQCDSNNNTKDIIDNKFCIVDIGVWISQNMEKIVTRITLNRSTTAE